MEWFGICTFESLCNGSGQRGINLHRLQGAGTRSGMTNFHDPLQEDGFSPLLGDKTKE